MPRENLLDFFEDFASSDDTFIVHDDGYRVRQITYRQMASSARLFAERLEQEAIRAGDKVVLWSENRIEWLTAFWGCLLGGVVVVPVDYRASEDLLRRVVGVVKARAVLVGDEVKRPALDDILIWDMAALGSSSPAERRAPFDVA